MNTGGQRGQSLVEFALVALIFFLFVFGIIQMGIVMEAHQTVARAANAAAKAVAIDVQQQGSTLSQEESDAWTAAEAAVKQGALAATASQQTCYRAPATVSASSTICGGTPSAADPLTVDVVANNACPSPPTSGSVGVQVTVEYLQPLSVPLISQFFGGRETIGGGTYLPLVVTAANMPCG